VFLVNSLLFFPYSAQICIHCVASDTAERRLGSAEIFRSVHSAISHSSAPEILNQLTFIDESLWMRFRPQWRLLYDLVDLHDNRATRSANYSDMFYSGVWSRCDLTCSGMFWGEHWCENWEVFADCLEFPGVFDSSRGFCAEGCGRKGWDRKKIGEKEAEPTIKCEGNG
jgi:hypothetical protein